MPINIKNKKGFTLVEMLISMAIFSVIILIVYQFQINVFKYNKIINSSLNIQQEARNILRPFAEEVRAATTSNNGDFAISIASTALLEFYSDIDNDGVVEKIRYFREDNDFKKGVIEPTGDPLVYDSASEEIVGIINNISNDSAPIFEYYGRDYDGITSVDSLAYPIDVSDIRIVRATLMVDEDPNNDPGPVEISTQSTFRNLKNN